MRASLNGIDRCHSKQLQSVCEHPDTLRLFFGGTEPVALSLQPDERIKIVSQQMETRNGAVRLEDARFIVSGGRGLGGPEPFKQLQELATAMGAEMAASRAA